MKSEATQPAVFKDLLRKKVAALRSRGCSQSEICTMLAINQSAVSRLLTEAIDRRLLIQHMECNFEGVDELIASVEQFAALETQLKQLKRELITDYPAMVVPKIVIQHIARTVA